MLKNILLLFFFLFFISDIKLMLYLIWNYLENIPEPQNTKYHVPVVLISDAKCIQFFTVSISNKLMWRVFPSMLQTQPKIPPLKNVRSLQNWRTLRSGTLGQLPGMCIFYGLSLHDHTSYFMKDVKIYSTASILHLYFILNFHCVTLVLHYFTLLIFWFEDKFCELFKLLLTVLFQYLIHIYKIILSGGGTMLFL